MPENGNSVESTSSNPSSESNSGFTGNLLPLYMEASFITKTMVVFVTVTTVMTVGYFFITWLLKDKPIDPVYTKVDSIKRVRHLTLVKHHYEGIIPVAKPNGKLQFLLIAPAEIEGYIDLSKMRVDLGRDSMLKVVLPEASVSEVWLNLNQAREYTWKKNRWFIGRSLEIGNYFNAYEQIRTALAKSKMDVEKRAVVNGIKEQTLEKAKDYIRNMVNGLGYRIEFFDSEDEARRFSPQRPGNNLKTLLQEYMDEDNPEKFKEKIDRLREAMGIQ
ncbi:MAG: DUF4230 domain-containing protein [Bacteroidetes bacterium]|nr:DUF4230 domain-containing protein [Bacteroidota bacterium]MCB0844829.1 DUF4230 domain-containing protein [Bacteroidota bacterium]MCB0851638.1 DUF4230 domain-containing protein [Bacteroidota bacterium]